MKIILRIPVECGEKTCASTPGKFCKYMTYSIVDNGATCQLFGLLSIDNGWVMRAADCVSLGEQTMD